MNAEVSIAEIPQYLKQMTHNGALDRQRKNHVQLAIHKNREKSWRYDNYHISQQENWRIQNRTGVTMANGMGTHQSAKMESDIWLTPPEILNQLGEFDLDPCTPVVRPWNTAKEHYNLTHDGLSQLWFGFVWMNPPYGRETHKWMNKLADHGNGIALIFARTETEMFVETVWNRASSVLFIHGRLYFHHENGERAKANSGAPSVLVGYGAEADKRLKECGIVGTFLNLKQQKEAV